MARPQSRRKTSASLLEIKAEAKRKGWAKYIRKGPGEEADERAMLAGCRFSIKRANHVCEFFEGRRGNKRKGITPMRAQALLTEGPWSGKTFKLLPWQRTFLQTGFGWVRYNSDWQKWVRRFRYLYLEVPKKNGKTPLLANLGNYLLIGDSFGRQINQYLAATTKKQAARCLVHATRVYPKRPELAELVTTKKLEGFEAVQFNDNLWEVIAADAASADGVNGHVLADEYHRWVGFEFMNAIRWALASQPEGIFCAITTAGNQQQSVCRQAHDKTLEVNSGRQVDQQWFGTIYGAEPGDDPHDEKTWKKANPSLGSTPDAPLKLSDFRADYETARKDPVQWRDWLQLRLGLWQTGQNAWLPIELFDAGEIVRAGAPKIRIKTGELTKSGKPKTKTVRKQVDCVADVSRETIEQINNDRIEAGDEPLYSIGGLDAATTRDTCAAMVTVEHWSLPTSLIWLPRFWLPEARAFELGDEIPWRIWADEGFVKLTPGEMIDFDTIYVDLLELFDSLGVVRLYYDSGFQAEWLCQRIEHELDIERVAHGQSFAQMSPAMQTAERMIRGKTLLFDGNPVLSWQFGNTVAKTNTDGKIRPVKPQHGSPKTIDGIVAGIMTLSDWQVVNVDDDDGPDVQVI